MLVNAGVTATVARQTVLAQLMLVWCSAALIMDDLGLPVCAKAQSALGGAVVAMVVCWQSSGLGDQIAAEGGGCVRVGPYIGHGSETSLFAQRKRVQLKLKD